MKEKLNLKIAGLGALALITLGGIIYGGWVLLGRNDSPITSPSSQDYNDQEATSSTQTKPSNPTQEFPAETIYPGLVLQGFDESTDSNGEKITVAYFKYFDPSVDVDSLRDNYIKWLDVLGWTGFGNGSSFDPNTGRVSGIGYEKLNMRVIVDFHDLENKISINVTYTK